MQTVRRSLAKMTEELAAHWRSYLLQSLLATAVIFGVLIVFTVRRPALVTSLGATTFILFAMPKSLTARAVNVVGGHLIGLGCGLLWGLVPVSGTVPVALLYAAAVGSALLIMVVVDAEHPPACGTALQFVSGGAGLPTVLALVCGVVLLAAVHRLLRPHLRDLA